MGKIIENKRSIKKGKCKAKAGDQRAGQRRKGEGMKKGDKSSRRGYLAQQNRKERGEAAGGKQELKNKWLIVRRGKEKQLHGSSSQQSNPPAGRTRQQ